MSGWKKILVMSALGVALSSVAQVNLRPEVAKTLQAAQEAIQAKQPDAALQRIQELRSNTQLTDPERMLLERVAVVAAMNAQKHVGTTDAAANRKNMMGARSPTLAIASA